MTTPTTLPAKPRRYMNPLPVLRTGAVTLKGVGKRTFTLLRGSSAVKTVAMSAVRLAVIKVLDPKGPYVAALSKNKKFGPLVKTVVAIEGYQLLVDSIAESTAGLVGKGFKESSVYTVPPEDIKTVPEKADNPVFALPSTANPVTVQWASTTPTTNISFKGQPVAKTGANNDNPV